MLVMWKFADEKKPRFTVYSVYPRSILTYPLHPKHNDFLVVWVRVL